MESTTIEIEEISLDLVDSKAVFVEADKQYPGQLCIQVLDQVKFRIKYQVYLSSYNVLVSNGLWDYFAEVLHQDGYTIYILPSAQKVLHDHQRVSQPLVIEGLRLPNDGELFPFQQYGLRRAFESGSFFFYNYGTGSGKTIIGAAGIQELLINTQSVDLVLAFTLASMKVNYQRALHTMTDATVEVVEGEKSYRVKRYKAEEAQVYVLNYERCHFDKASLIQLVKGKQVLFLLDEVQKVLNRGTLARQGLDSVMKSCGYSIVWPLSASVVKSDPNRFHEVFSFLPQNPLGNTAQFERRYLDKRITKWVKSKSGAGYVDEEKIWNLQRLEEIRHRVAPMTHAVRKTDPGVSHLFKGLSFIEVPVQMSDEDRDLYKLFEKLAVENELTLEVPPVQFYSALRYLCNTPEGLTYWNSALAKTFLESGFTFTSKHSAKMKAVCDLVEEIRDQGDKTLLFSSWVKLSLQPIARELQRRRIPFVIHHGQMSSREQQEAQDRFKRERGITVFLSSDAGAQGLNFQESRFVINMECPYDYDLLMQRNDRIDRADSYLEGLTSYVFYNEDSVEERILGINRFRQRQSSATQGTLEVLDRVPRELTEEQLRESEVDKLPPHLLHFLMFGNNR